MEGVGSAGSIHFGDCLEVLAGLQRGSARLAYVDPPFNTGEVRRSERTTVVFDAEGPRRGFHGRTYRQETRTREAYADRFDDYLGFLMPRLEACLPVLAADASLFVHLDFREVHHVKVALDALLGRERFMNEIVWAYDYGARSKSRWPAKHDTLLWYALDPSRHVFDFEAMDRIPYMAPGLVTPEKAARGKTPTDVWWHTIVPTNSRERTGWPGQKPLGILERIVKVHSAPGDLVLDFFAGSGTTGEAAARHDRRFLLIDREREACELMARRLAEWAPECVGFAGRTEACRPEASPAD